MENRSGVIENLINRTAKHLNELSLIFLAVMMLVTALDVLMRYIFNSPIAGAIELSSFSLMLAIVLSIPYAGAMGRHISIDILTSHLSDSKRVVIENLSIIISLFLVFVIIWRSVVYALSTMEQHIVTPVLQMPDHPFILLLAAAFVVYFVVLAWRLVHSLAATEDAAGKWRWLGAALVIWALMFVILVYARDLPWRFSPLVTGAIGMIILFCIFLIGAPVFVSLLLVGFLGIAYLRGLPAALGVMGSTPFNVSTHYEFTVIPLFVLMGEFCFYSGIGKDLYKMAYKWLGHLPGGLSIATVGACGGFAAVCGDSMATAVTMGTVALPEMKRYNYAPSLATGTVAAGGTLGVLIPPSLAFILYALLAEQSIAELFIAGILPGLLLISLFAGTIYIRVRRNPSLGPPGPISTFKEKMSSLQSVWATILLFAIVIGGMYAGVFTPTEGGGIGAFGAFAIGLLRGKLSFRSIVESLSEAGKISAVCMTILIGANVFGYFLAASKLPMALATSVTQLAVPPLIILACILLIYLILGCLMPAIPMLVLTVPIFFPVIKTLGFDPVWFGVIMVLMFEMAVITPPMGINVLALQSVVEDISLGVMFRGVSWFLVDIVICILILIAFPQIALILPAIFGT